MEQSSAEGFGNTSPPPAMYDTSTSTAESSWTPRGGKKGGPLHHQSSQQQPQQQQQQQQLYSQPKQSSNTKSRPPYTTATRGNGSFKSQAALLVSNKHSSPQHPSPSRTPRNKYVANDSASDVPASPSAASYASAASQYIMSQQKQRNSGPYRTDFSSQRDGSSVTDEMNSSMAPTMTTQSEPGAPSFANYSYYTLSDHYSSSAAATAPSPERRRLSAAARFANSNSNSNPEPQTPNSYSYSQQSSQPPSLSQRQPISRSMSQEQMQQQHMNYPASPGAQGSQQQQTSTPNPQSNPFLSNNRLRYQTSKGKPMSVSERIRRLKHKSHPNPEPGPVEEDNLTPEQLGQFYKSPRHSNNGGAQGDSNEIAEDYAATPQTQKQHLQEQQNTRYAAASRHRSRGEAAAAAREAARITGRTTTNLTHSNSIAEGMEPELTPEAARPSRSEQAIQDSNAVRERPSTSLPPVRRRRPLQQPAFNEQTEEPQQQQQQQLEPTVSTGSPVRVQELKRQLWDAEERLNVSSDHSNSSAPRRAARSLSPRQYRHSAGSNMNKSTPTPGAANNTSSSNVGGFKSKFYQAAMAAQRGERTTTPPRSRPSSNDDNGGVSPHNSASREMSGTPPRPPNAKNLQAASNTVGQGPPTPPRSYGGPLHPVQPMPPTPPHQSHVRGTSVSPKQAQQTAEVEALQQPSLQHPPPVGHPTQQRQQQQPPLVQGQLANPYRQSLQEQTVQAHNPPIPVTQADKKTVAYLLAKLNAVSRDDPQAALAQIDSILRAESGNNHGSGDQHLLAQQAMLMNAAAEGMVTPQQQQQIQQVCYEQGYPVPPHHQQPQYSPNNMQQSPPANEGDDDASSDDETSVSSITDPTYMSSKPTHEQLHDVPPPRGLSTATFRRPRPSALQGYITPGPSPAISGLELVQRHHQRQSAKKDRHGHAYNHHRSHQHQPPPTINVADTGYHPNPADNFVDNLMSTSIKHTEDQQLQTPKTQYQEVSKQGNIGDPQQHVESQHEQVTTQQQAMPQQQPQTMQQKYGRHDGEDVWANIGDKLYSSENGAHDMYGFPTTFEDSTPHGSSQLQQQPQQQQPVSQSIPQEPKTMSPSPRNLQEPKEKVKQVSGILPRHPRDSAEKHAFTNNGKSKNPFDDNVEDGSLKAKQGIARSEDTTAMARERKLDLFMSRKKRKEEEELLQLLEEHEARAQLTGNSLAQKIRTWDELSNPVSRVSKTSEEDEARKRIVTSSQTSAAASSSDKDAASASAPVNTSAGAVSSGTPSITSRSSRRSHPWNAENDNSRLKIDFRDTSMDNALGVEAECFSQSQASPARDMRRAARLQQQQHMSTTEAKRVQHPPQAQDSSLQGSVPPARELRKERLARAAMQQQSDKVELTQRDHDGSEIDTEVPASNVIEALPPQAGFPRFNSNVYDDGEQQDTGFEVTPIYSADPQDNGGKSSSEYDSNWVTLPANSYFESTKKKQSKIVASLIDQDKLPVSMVRAPELPPVVTDAFVDVPIPYDERSTNMDSRRSATSSKENRAEIIDVSGVKETPAPLPTTEASNRGRRAFSSFLKKRASKTNKNSMVPRSPSPKKKGSVAAPGTSDKERAPSVSRRGRRISSKSPARDRARSLDETGRIRNPNFAKKVSRFLKVYGNDINDDEVRGHF